MIKEMQTTGDPHQALVWPGHWEGLQTVPKQRQMKQQQGLENQNKISGSGRHSITPLTQPVTSLKGLGKNEFNAW